MLELMTKFFIEREPAGRTEKGRSIDSFGTELSTGSRNAVKSDQPASNGDKYLTSLTRPATAALTSRRGDCVVHIVLPISFSFALIHPYWLTGRKALSYLLTYLLSSSVCLSLSHFLFLPLPPALSPSLSVSACLYHSLSASVFLSLYHCLVLSLLFPVSVCFCLSVLISLCYGIVC